MSDLINAETEQPIEPEERPLSTPVFRHVARAIFSTFILTFIASRVMVILIMDKKVPDFYLHVGKGNTHVHHLNYGIFILSAVGAYLLFRRPGGRRLTCATIAYGIGLGLTFDEFGMWVHLGGSYWQGASFDAVVIIGAALGLLAYAPSPKRFRTQHWIWAIFMAAVVIASVTMLAISLTRYAHRLEPWFQKIEQNQPQ
jgi:hypothetical protein